ncbi:hypothetical protein C0995_012573 [Termitomyces sp. Mi166|nr:hypothetical protein C0995_012573 [Termitomyces sp. Mi166\
MTRMVTTNFTGGTPTETLTNTVSTPTLPVVSSTLSAPDLNTGFFQNNGTVAGTFTVVGLVGLAFLIFLATWHLRLHSSLMTRTEGQKGECIAIQAAMGSMRSSQ